MKKYIFLLTYTFLFSFFYVQAQQSNAWFVSDPSLTPDGNDVLFVYETDIWKVNSVGGLATRLTAMDGLESNPKVSPDGKWLAFSSTQNGNADVYVMPLNGGEIQQLTFSDAAEQVDSWAWNSEFIYFNSGQFNMVSTYKISRKGGTHTRILGEDFFNYAHNVCEDPSGNTFYFCETYESFRYFNRKRYIGDQNPNILSFNSKNFEYKELTTYNGKDLWSSVDKTGTLYFASDEVNKVYNLCTIQNGIKKNLTNFETAIYKPQVSANGNKVVFVKDYQLFVYNVATGKTEKPQVDIFKNEMLQTDKPIKVAGNISYFDVSPDNKKFAFVSRGKLFVSDVKGKFVKEIKTNEKERVTEVKWLKDNETLLFLRTNKGWGNLFTISANKDENEKQITDFQKNGRFLELSPKRDKAAYLSGNSDLNLVDLVTLKTETIVEDEFWFRGDIPRFSPDGNYLAYTAFRNFETDIFVYDLKLKTKTNITNTGVPESDPFWSPDGKYLYFSANRFNASYPRGNGSMILYRVPLYRFANDFKSDEYNKLFKKEEKADSVIQMKFEWENLWERWENLDLAFDNQYSPIVFKEKEKTIVLFNAQNNSEYEAWKHELTPFDKAKTEKISSSSFSQIVKAKDTYYALSSENIYQVKLSENKFDKINIEFEFAINLNNEFVQMFYENWAALADNFYDVNYHGIDWEKTKKQYETYLPYVRHRQNLTTLFNDLLGELNASHLDFRTEGDELKTYYNIKSQNTGILFENENPFIVKRIVKKSPADVFGNPILAGDELVAVNSVLVDKTKNRDSYFNATSLGDEITLTFKRKGETFDAKFHPISTYAQVDLLYDEWIDKNQKKVDKLGNQKIAYAHMKDMGDGSLNRFLIDMTTEAWQKEALILDLRYNRGGNVHDEVLQFLSQKPYLQWKYRNGKMSPQPNFAPADKPIVLLINEYSLSDAEMTAAGFKQMGLGKIVGTETYRWIIFTSAQGLVDGSYTRLPAWGCFYLNGNDLEITGVKPDIYIKNTFKDRFSDTDPQLDKAIEEVLKSLKK